MGRRPGGKERQHPSSRRLEAPYTMHYKARMMHPRCWTRATEADHPVVRRERRGRHRSESVGAPPPTLHSGLPPAAFEVTLVPTIRKRPIIFEGIASDFDEIPRPAQYPLWDAQALAAKLEEVRPWIENWRETAIKAAMEMLHGQ